MLSPKIFQIFLFFTLLSVSIVARTADHCAGEGVWLQVLGSGGPELTDGRASSSYLVWLDKQARVMVDAGTGSSLNFERSGAKIENLQVMLFTHLHVDHSADFPGLVKASWFTGRTADLPVYGPSENRWMPDMQQFVNSLFLEKQGAYRYLSDFLDGSGQYKIIPHVIDVEDKSVRQVFDEAGIRVSAIPVHHGPIPALAWRIELAGKTIVFSGDMNGDYATLPELAAGADILVAHNAIPEEAQGIARRLHMPPSVIGRIAHQAGVKKLILSHRMNRTLGREKITVENIRRFYSGPLEFANDMDCFSLTRANSYFH